MGSFGFGGWFLERVVLYTVCESVPCHCRAKIVLAKRERVVVRLSSNESEELPFRVLWTLDVFLWLPAISMPVLSA